MIYLMIKWNIIAGKVGFMKMSTSQQNVQYVSRFIETKSGIQAQPKFRRKCGREPPVRYTIGLWHKQFMETGSAVQKRELADLTHQKKKLNMCVHHVLQDLESPFLRSFRYDDSLSIKFFIKTCDFMHMKCSYYRPLSQKISRNEKSLQWARWRG